MAAKPALHEADRKEDALVSHGRRNINLIWETTQAIIAITITVVKCYIEMTGSNSPVLDNAFTLIIALYFVRMNHVTMGGVPPQHR